LSSPVLRRIAIKSCLCARSLTRVLGSVTLAIDKARKGAWSEKGKVSAAHAWGKPGKEVARVVGEMVLGWLLWGLYRKENA